MTRPEILQRLLADGPVSERELLAICGWPVIEFAAVAESLRQSGQAVPSSERPGDGRLWVLAC